MDRRGQNLQSMRSLLRRAASLSTVGKPTDETAAATCTTPATCITKMRQLRGRDADRQTTYRPTSRQATTDRYNDTQMVEKLPTDGILTSSLGSWKCKRLNGGDSRWPSRASVVNYCTHVRRQVANNATPRRKHTVYNNRHLQRKTAGPSRWKKARIGDVKYARGHDPNFCVDGPLCISPIGRHNFSFIRHTFLVVTLKKMVKIGIHLRKLSQN